MAKKDKQIQQEPAAEETVETPEVSEETPETAEVPETPEEGDGSTIIIIGGSLGKRGKYDGRQ